MGKKSINKLEIFNLIQGKFTGVSQEEISIQLKITRQTVKNNCKQLISENRIESYYKNRKKFYRIKRDSKLELEKISLVNHFYSNPQPQIYLLKLSIIENLIENCKEQNKKRFLGDCTNYILSLDKDLPLEEISEVLSLSKLGIFFPKYNKKTLANIFNILKENMKEPESKNEKTGFYKYELRSFLHDIFNEIQHQLQFQFLSKNIFSNEFIHNFSSSISNFLFNNYFVNPENVFLSDNFEDLDFEINISFRVSELYKKYVEIQGGKGLRYWNTYKHILQTIEKSRNEDFNLSNYRKSVQGKLKEDKRIRDYLKNTIEKSLYERPEKIYELLKNKEPEDVIDFEFNYKTMIDIELKLPLFLKNYSDPSIIFKNLLLWNLKDLKKVMDLHLKFIKLKNEKIISNNAKKGVLDYSSLSFFNRTTDFFKLKQMEGRLKSLDDINIFKKELNEILKKKSYNFISE